MRTIVSSDGTAIAYDRVGDGPAVVVVNGAFGDRTTDAPLAECLASRFTVYTYDRRGHGSSGDIAPFDPNREYEDLEAVLAEAGDAACVFGISAGASIALEAAARGLAMSRLAVWEPPYVLDGSRAPMPEDFRGRLETMLAEGRRRDMVEMFMADAALFPEEVVAMMRHTPMWSVMESSAHTLVYDARLLGDFSLPVKRLAWVTVPTLVLDGGMARWMTDAAEAVAKAVPDACRRSVPGQPHMFAPDALAPALIDFFTADN